MTAQNQNLSSPSHHLFSTLCALASFPMTPAFKSPRPQHPKFLLPGIALPSLPTDSSFPTWARPDFHHVSPHLITLTIHISLPDPSETGQPGTYAPSTRKPSQTTQPPPPPPWLPAPGSHLCYGLLLANPHPILHLASTTNTPKQVRGGAEQRPQAPSLLAFWSRLQHSRILP